MGIASEGFLATRRALGRPLAGSALARRVLLFGSVHDGGRLAPDDARFMLQASSRARRLRAAVEEAAACDLSSVIAEVRAPVGAIRGERDQVVSAAAMRALVAARPDTVEESIADSGHVPQLERPGEFVSALERVLDGLTAVTDS